MVIDDVAGNLPYIVGRDHRIVAAFAKKAAAEEWAQMRSWSDESRFTVHTASESPPGTHADKAQSPSR
jgi:hypothetical protein